MPATAGGGRGRLTVVRASGVVVQRLAGGAGVEALRGSPDGPAWVVRGERQLAEAVRGVDHDALAGLTCPPARPRVEGEIERSATHAVSAAARVSTAAAAGGAVAAQSRVPR